MATDKKIEMTLSIDSAIARAKLDEIKKIINELKGLLADPSAFTAAFTGLETKVATVQDKLQGLETTLKSLGDGSATFIFQDLSTNLTEVNQTVVDLNQETNTLVQNFDNISTKGGQVGAEVLPNIIAKTQELTTATEDVKEKTSSLAELFETDLPNIRGNFGELSNALEDVKTGFSAANDLAGIFGIQNENVTKTINKLTKAQEGLTKAQEIAKTVEKAYAKAVKGLAGAKKAYYVVTNLVSKGLKIFKIALASTGIGLLITGVAMLIAHFDKVKEAMGKLMDKFTPLKTIVNNVKYAFDFVVESVGNLFNGFGLISTILGKLSERFPGLKKVIDPVKAVFDKLKNITGLLSGGLDLIKKGVAKLTEIFPALGRAVQGVKDFFNDMIDVGKRALSWLGFTSDEVEKANKKIIDSNKEATKELDNQGKEQADNKAKNDEEEIKSEENKTHQIDKHRQRNVKSAKDRAREQERIRRDALKREFELQQLRLRNMEDGRAKELAAEELRYQQEQEKFKGNKEALEELLKFHNQKVLEINTTWNEADEAAKQEKADKEKADAEAKKQEAEGIAQMLQAVKDAGNKKEQENADKQVEIYKAKKEAVISITEETVNLLGIINDKLAKDGKKNNEIQKTLALVKIGIDTAKAISSAISNANSSTPDNVATGGIAGIAKFIALSAQILTAAAKAKSILGSGQGSAGGSAPTAPTVSAPQISAPRISGTPIITGQRQPEPIKVFVSEADIRNTQNKVAVIESQSEVV